MRLGVTPPVEMAGVRAAVEVAVLAERLGYADVWSSEVGSADAFTPLAAVAARTATIRLGTSLVPVYTRPPALLAMTAAALQDQSGGRFVLGIGASTPQIVERWMGTAFDRPVERVRDYVSTLRRILVGERVEFAGETVRVDGFRRQTGPVAPIPIHVGALGPRMCRLAGALADGVQFALMTPDGVREALEVVRLGAGAAGRDHRLIEVVLRVPIAVDDEGELVRLVARRLLTSYAITPTYGATLTRQGYGAAVAPVVAAWETGDRAAAMAALPEDVVDAFVVQGSASACRARLAEYEAAGVTSVALMHLSAASTPEERGEHVAGQLVALVDGSSPSDR
jgi:probable F420-dependent oxidoreductase